MFHGHGSENVPKIMYHAECNFGPILRSLLGSFHFRTIKFALFMHLI
jgi:hypothetical protein